MLQGDVIDIPPIGPSDSQRGMSTTRIYALKADDGSAALEGAGGLTRTGRIRRGFAGRIENHSHRRVKSFLLADRVSQDCSILETCCGSFPLARFENAVPCAGMLPSLPLLWKEGMRVSELIPPAFF